MYSTLVVELPEVSYFRTSRTTLYTYSIISISIFYEGSQGTYLTLYNVLSYLEGSVRVVYSYPLYLR